MQAHFNMCKPYIGVTGFMSAGEVRSVLRNDLPLGRDLMVGVLSSYKMLTGRGAKFPGRYPEPEKIRDIFVSHPRAVNLIHYATDDRPTLPHQLERLIKLGGPHLHGFQLNMAWPEPNHLEYVASHVQRIVLQLGARAIEVGGSPREVSERLKAYHGLITDVLLDPSGGRGELIDLKYALNYLQCICPDHPHLGIGIAGGLSPETLVHIVPLMKEFPNLSTDVEGRVRETATDTLVIPRVLEHLAMHQRLFF